MSVAFFHNLTDTKSISKLSSILSLFNSVLANQTDAIHLDHAYQACIQTSRKCVLKPHIPRFHRYKIIQAFLASYAHICNIAIKKNIIIPIRNIHPKNPGSLFYLSLLLCTTLFVSADIDKQKSQQVMQDRYGADGVVILSTWQQLVYELDKLPDAKKIQVVNDFFNQNIMYRDDAALWRKSDYWATPLETLGMRAGDCEDFTIAKYITLLQLGIAQEQLRLIYVKAQIGGPNSKVFQAHMVLGYYPTAESVPLVLDNLIGRIEPANQRPDLRPIFSFNSEGLWVGNAPAQHSTSRLSRWRDLLQRTEQEGITLDALTRVDTKPEPEPAQQ